MIRLQIKPIPNACCWKTLVGANQQNVKPAEIKAALVYGLNAFGYSGPRWKLGVVPGAFILCGAYGVGADIGQSGNEATASNAKEDVEESVENLCEFFEKHQIGTVVEMPEFPNPRQGSKIIPRMILLDQKHCKTKITEWSKSPSVVRLLKQQNRANRLQARWVLS